MSTLLKIITNRLLLAFLGVAFLALVIWYVGPLVSIASVAPLESVFSRVLTISILFALWLLTAIWRFFRARRANQQMLDSIAEPASAAEEASAEELATLEAKMQEAVATLKQRNFSKTGGSRFIYELPWYTIIGPPGAGKTTLLSNSGLDFPLEESHGRYSIKGVGGTRNCDWWFTDQAVLLDTAGRYTTQDSESEVDKAAWTGFLGMLKDKRPRRPLNGVLVAISLQDLLENDADELAQTAKTIRSRIEELYQQLGIAPPVYLMVTKCDLLAGFTEFFADLNQEERKQVWGFTLPHTDTADNRALLKDELAALVKTVQQQSIDKMHRELSRSNRESIYSFPLQLSSIQERLLGFTQQLTVKSNLLENVLFRGVYLTSATQTGSTIDKVIASVSNSFGVDSSMASSQADSGRSYFINTLLNDVVFAESGLAGTNLKSERRLQVIQAGAGGLIALTLLGSLGLWASSYAKNKNALERIDTTAGEVRQKLAALPGDSLDIVATGRALSSARELAYASAPQSDDEDGFVVESVGLYQGDEVNDAATQKYQDLLIDTLLPRLLVRLEHQMHAESNNSEFIFEALKTYQMVGSREHYDASAITGWFNFDLDNNLPADTPTATRTALKEHIATLFEKQPYRMPRPLDQGLINQYQQIAAGISLAQRAYGRLKSDHLDVVNSHLKITRAAGADVPLAFDRTDGEALDRSIPLFFTRDGYQEKFLPASVNVSTTLTEDSWVLGPFASTGQQSVSSEQLSDELKTQYYREYMQHWDALIGNIKLKPVDGLSSASEFIALITDPDSPLKNLLVLIGEQTTLTQPAEEENAEGGDSGSSNREAQLNRLLGRSNDTATEEQEPIDPVTLKYARIHQMIDDWENNGSQLDQVLGQLADINLQLLPMAHSPAGSVDTKLSTDLAVNLQKLDTKSDRLPEPLASLVKNLTNEVGDVVGGGFCKQLNTAWQAEVYGYYQRAIRNRYPVNRKGTADIAISDFGAFFGRGGLIDQFVDTYLAAHVSKTPRQWTWTGKGSAKCLSDNTLKQLAYADDIKNTFFSGGGQTPSLQFDIVPEQLTMSPQVEQLFLDVGGNVMEYFHGPIKGSTSFTWPNANNNTQVNLRILPVVPGSSSSISMSGPWAVLRLFDQGSRKAANGRLTVNYSFGGRAVSMSMATSSFNPLNSVALRNFRCPETL